MASPRPNNVVTFGKYVLVERLGRGGMAEVWRAKIVGPAGFQRTLVVKRILPHLVEDPHFVQMFVAEARLSARLNHANIVQVFELGDVDGEYFLAMEYVRGRDLVSLVRAQMQRGHTSPGMAAFVMREVCRALGYAHSLTDENGTPLRLIHRDVSPSNVMISFDGAVKLLDFGIAKALAEANENKTQTGTLKGKFGYMAPEQVEGREIDHRADLFAAGIVLHEVLTGRRLFKGGSDLQTLAMVRDCKIEPPSAQNPSVPSELDRICLKALSKSLDERYRSCEEMAVDLDDVVHQLKWGPERMAQAMKDLFPEDAVPTESGKYVGVDVGALPSASAARRGDRSRRFAFGFGGVATLAGIVWLIAATLRANPPTHPQAHADTTPPAMTSPPPAAIRAAPLPSKVNISLDSAPRGADVTLEGDPQPRGKTPITIELPRSDTRGTGITISLKGYAPHTLEVLPLADREVPPVALEKLPSAAESAGKSSTHSSSKDSKRLVSASKPSGAKDNNEEKPARAATHEPAANIREGGIVDPFAETKK